MLEFADKCFQFAEVEIVLPVDFVAIWWHRFQSPFPFSQFPRFPLSKVSSEFGEKGEIKTVTKAIKTLQGGKRESRFVGKNGPFDALYRELRG